MRRGLDRTTIKAIYDRVAGRYDLQHGLLTGWADQRGRRFLVGRAVTAGDRVLDAGAGTGATALTAARKVGPEGQVVLFDLSRAMLAVARKKAMRLGLTDRMEFCAGDILNLPFADEAFDVVLSTYSLCPVFDPARGARELYRLVKRGGLLGVAHSGEPAHPAVRRMADRLERLVWKFPLISLGCRAVSVLPQLVEDGAELLCHHSIGMPLWPFEVFVVRKPSLASGRRAGMAP
ncbi:MAG: methyltransferase domain-containing protein [Deltaproteobacteria bacterium]|nr:MAG: methyltransferase domain-containing protein [Deltaproteobacteria bacterium]